MARRELETDIEQKCVKHAHARGCDNTKLDKAKRGYPDQIFFLPGGRKRPGEKPRKQQAAVHRRLAALGHPVAVIESFDEFTRLLR